MMISVTLTSQVKAAANEKITASQIREWVANIPDTATIEAITQERGHQRDPYSVFVGLRATWTETR